MIRLYRINCIGKVMPVISTARPAGEPVTPEFPAPPGERIDPRAIGWWRAQLAVLTVVVLAAELVVAGLWTWSRWPVPSGLVLAGSALILVALVIVVPPAGYRIHRWEADQERVYAASGWLWREWRIAPINRVQTVDTKQGPLQRAFGLVDVTVTTASAAGPVIITGLDAERGRALVDRLAEAAGLTDQDGT